jgi:hypothetical protein
MSDGSPDIALVPAGEVSPDPGEGWCRQPTSQAADHVCTARRLVLVHHPLVLRPSRSPPLPDHRQLQTQAAARSGAIHQKAGRTCCWWCATPMRILRVAGTALTCCGRCHPWGVSKLRGWWSASRTTRSSGSCAARLCDATRPSSRWRGIACCGSKTWRRSGWTPVPARCWRCSGIRAPECGAVHPWRDDWAVARAAGRRRVGRRGAAGLAQGLDLAAAACQPATGPRPLSGPVGPWRSRGNRLARHHPVERRVPERGGSSDALGMSGA